MTIRVRSYTNTETKTMTVNRTLWVEKHRPETLDDIIGHDDQVERLKAYVDDEEVPHMIFAGPPGTGKTAAIMAFAREVFGDSWSANIDEMNASDERGIDVVRNKIKGIARSSPAGGALFSILFLDEADALTKDAQKPLRRMMEQQSDVTRFFLTCNYQDDIIPAIQSRCSIVRFGRLKDDEIRLLLEDIAEKEDVEYDDEAMDRLVRAARGDARSAVTSLQDAAITGEVTVGKVESVVGVIDDQLVEEIVDLAIEGEVDEAMGLFDVELLKAGANTRLLANSFLRVIKRKDFPAPGKRKVIHKLAECDWRVDQSANPNVQWHSFLTDINVGYHLDFNSYGEGGS